MAGVGRRRGGPESGRLAEGRAAGGRSSATDPQPHAASCMLLLLLGGLQLQFITDLQLQPQPIRLPPMHVLFAG